ncbi:hypothetical protein [Diaphorobacter aerolatus]|uniref:Uncharacterized protein n=1 Tax=Diaphorobacter aerolatus TaxID=1288495 RepID=A0A7H0GJA0_9BURK|nr:hypothetical protein [Diaphorobacter aerolatus]QNP48366.1 hypothetical protein H9K75_20825 [Diaphorobacter aerolatus]
MNKIKAAYERLLLAANPYSELYGYAHLCDINSRIAPHGYHIQKDRGWGDHTELGYFVTITKGDDSPNIFIRALNRHNEDVFKTSDPASLDTWLKDTLYPSLTSQEQSFGRSQERIQDRTKTQTKIRSM